MSYRPTHTLMASLLVLALLFTSLGRAEQAYATVDLGVLSTVAVAPRSSIPNDFERGMFQPTDVVTDTDTVTETTTITDTGLDEDTDVETLTASTATTTAFSQLLLVPRAARSEIPANPQFEVNSRQAHLRDHHLTNAPIPTEAMEEQPELEPLEKGPATDVLPMGVAADSPVVIVRNRALNDSESQDITSTVLEPTVAASRDGVVLYTANWFASISKDDAQSFTYLNPETFPETDGHQFCCDQAALYDPVNDIMFWFLQYIHNGSSNKMRLVYAQGEDIGNENWRFYDFTPQSIGGWDNEWFDFPDLALARDHLYISTNSFSTQGNGFARAVVVRLPLAEIAADEPVTLQYFDAEESFSFRFAQGAQEVMYFGSHDFARFGSGIEVYAWPEDSDQISLRRIQVAPWSNDPRESLGPDGNAWLRRTDFRMSTGWVRGGEVGFAWSAAQDEDFAQPHVRVAIVDMNGTGSSPVAQPHLWNDNLAFAYLTSAVNSAGTLGVSVAYGGGGLGGVHPSHAVGLLRKTEAGYIWQLVATNNGDNGPADGRWGDYLSIHPDGRNPQAWLASGYILRGGELARDVVPLVVYFQEPVPITEPSGAQQTLAELREQVEVLRDQIDALLQTIEALAAQIGEE